MTAMICHRDLVYRFVNVFKRSGYTVQNRRGADAQEQLRAIHN